jgi:FkbH-like protein
MFINALDTELSANKLTDRRWSLGLRGEKPESTTVFFAPNGQIEGFHNLTWQLADDVLIIFDAGGHPLWIFTAAAETGGILTLTGRREGTPAAHTPYVLVEYAATAKPDQAPTRVAEDGGELSTDMNVRLVIWDLDETFWHGTLSEEGVEPIEGNVDIVKKLTGRGIINAVCSKNDFEPTRAKLVELGIWDYFVFPRIAFAPKGAMVQDIVAASQLRNASVMFVDDNALNLNEALHYNPGLQVATPDFLPKMLDDDRFKGKPDPDRTRLKRYKVLEDKIADRQSGASDNLEFLRQSEIKISFHTEVPENFDRIHDLVNRTNQLNFTKNRWPEDRADAEATYRAELQANFSSHAGFVKVSDRYGDYGICGFYLVNGRKARHFLFSCRAMNMGVEQFVWRTLGRPHVAISGEVISDIASSVDWIEAVPNAEQKHASASAPKGEATICIRGACDLEQMAHYLYGQGSIVDEHPIPFRGWSVHPVVRAIAANSELVRPEIQALIKRIPGLPAGRFDSAVINGKADHYILSFSSEMMCGLYRSRSTGLILPFHLPSAGKWDFADVQFEQLAEKAKSAATEVEWKFMQDEFEFVGVLEKRLFENDLEVMFSHLRGKHVIILMLNTTVGRRKWMLDQFEKINEIVRPIAMRVQSEGTCDLELIELNEFVLSEDDLAPDEDYAGSHFARPIYRRLAERVAMSLNRRRTIVDSSPQPV